ncbi:hypothetical protein N7468_006093 [Penicillium chermesinum]|uniref:Zn(2)-C6 fungal-type domain-containing protein n=1 Tax=Penicillium chermesinum TaxID=63820 RepID=A0A9W9TNV2_9EURO|nr:uncharacterized protein N7468_006093 [Penicillium chermesinum]KAJ5233137.1 hypothetical protein N7468_006093 [Penicillium chermesinum]
MVVIFTLSSSVHGEKDPCWESVPGLMATPLKKGKKACTECRQQKAKCDVYLNPGQPCSRCLRVKADCVVSDPFKREHKRKRLSDLQRESDELRQRLQTWQSVDPDPSAGMSLLTAAAEIGGRGGPSSDSFSMSPQVSSESYTPQLLAPHGLTSTTPAPVPAPNANVPTLPRTLNGVQVAANEIDDLFDLFFRHFSQFFPILRPKTKPNAYYAQSPLLFWAIIGSSCRAYPQNPTLMIALARSIVEMAFLSALSKSPPWYNIQAILLILTWPFPRGDHPEVGLPLGGMLLHIAMQNGLHIPLSSHEFCRVQLPVPSEADLLRRSELWALSVMTYQRVCMQKGQLPRVNQAQDPSQRSAIFEKIPPWMSLKLRCQDLIARSSEMLLKNGLGFMSVDREQSLDALLLSYENETKDLELQAHTDDQRFDVFFCRLTIQSFHFYKIQTIASSGCCPRIVTTACNVIDYVQSLTDRVASLTMLPNQIAWGLLLAATSLTRILKSQSAAEGVETIRARSSLFTAINLAKQMSVDSADLSAKTVTVLTSIWNSNKAFRKADGTDFTTLRIRGRLALSPVLDAVWWWRDEFDPQSRVRAIIDPRSGRGYSYSQSSSMKENNGETEDGNEMNRLGTGATLSSGDAHDLEDPLMINEQFIADLEWAFGDDAFFSLDPLPPNWASTTTLF